MTLLKIRNKSLVRCHIYRNRAAQIEEKRYETGNWETVYLTESLIYDLWQLWNRYWKEFIFATLTGTNTVSGDIIVPRASNNSKIRIAYEAKQYSLRQNVTLHGHSCFRVWNEPTWGDLGKLANLISGFSLPNSNAAYAGISAAPLIARLQATRNACAHKNDSTILQLKQFNEYGYASRIGQPSDIAWLNLVGTNDVGVYDWINQMESAFLISTETL